MGFTATEGSEKGSQRGSEKGGFQKMPRTPLAEYDPLGVRPIKVRLESGELALRSCVSAVQGMP